MSKDLDLGTPPSDRHRGVFTQTAMDMEQIECHKMKNGWQYEHNSCQYGWMDGWIDRKKEESANSGCLWPEPFATTLTTAAWIAVARLIPQTELFFFFPLH